MLWKPPGTGTGEWKGRKPMIEDGIGAGAGNGSQRMGQVERAAALTIQSMPPGEAEEFGNFIRILYERADVDDLEQYAPEVLGGIASSIWSWLERRQPGALVVRVFNPEQSSHGFDSPNTILQIVTDDMPFIIDSVLGELSESNFQVVRILHPILETQRDENALRVHIERAVMTEGHAEAERAARDQGYVRESILHLEIERQSDPAVLQAIESQMRSVLGDVKLVVGDWRPMKAALHQVVQDIKTNAPKTVDTMDLEESLDFLSWLLNDHFAFLGMRDYEIIGSLETGDLKALPETGLGLLRDPETRVLRRQGQLVIMTPEVRDFLRQSVPIIISKANVRSRVHRRAYMDYIGIKLYGEDGAVVGERRMVGLFTSAAYNRSPRDIPLLRRKIELIRERAHLPRDAHDDRALVNILETYPRDELFQARVDELVESAVGIVRLQKRPQTKIFVRYDRFDRFVSVLVFVPRDKYNTRMRIRIGAFLTQQFEGYVSAFYPSFGDSPLARVLFIISKDDGDIPRIDFQSLERRIEAFTRDWHDDLRLVLLARHGGARGRELSQRYVNSFSVAYREQFSCDVAVEDIGVLEGLPGYPGIALKCYRTPSDRETALRLKLYHWDTPIPLSDCLVVFENMGLKVIDEIPYTMEMARDAGETSAGEDAGGRTIWIHDFFMTHRTGTPIDLDAVKDTFEATFRAAWFGQVENDGFNRLVVEEAMDWRDVMVLRALARFRRQTGLAFSDQYIINALCNQGTIAKLLVQLFQWRFDPDICQSEDERCTRQEEIVERINAALDDVQSLDVDRIIRRFTNLVMAAQRTNFYQVTTDGSVKSQLAIKFASRKIQSLPQPKPLYEIFVYSPRVEGVHLRNGKVARGGIRWSDRAEDFRTEVLSLTKAQQVKNVVIVPVGAKGGFVPRQLPPPGSSRDAVVDEAIACYRMFISSLLDITDNLVDGAPVPPERVVAYDEPDPYLVVAADKGTATFSDIANDVAAGYDFWLGDAFASGGRTGYDHKRMGITARGAWEAVRRHFRELDWDIQTTPFTAVGVGDMSGDVFGNGMLLSEKTRLIAAFDHRDIFIDPNPDPDLSYQERKRMFALPRSSWSDYSRDLISSGGGVFSRQRKSIPVSQEMARVLNIDDTSVTPSQLIQAILRAPVDLLWFGGIGAYVKAHDESHLEVNDRSNDAIRINGREVGAKVIGEGANLGVTQRGRIEYARKGGRINTDFIDNAGGVDCSDHEVNIKVALDSVVRSGILSVERRNQILEDMTDEVAALVLRNNYEQTLALSVAEATAPEDLDAHGRFMRALERQGVLDRAVENLPDEERLLELKESGQGLTRPEIATLMSYAKIALYDAIIETDAPDDPYLDADLIRYFPREMGDQFVEALRGHRLRREIVATELANDLVNTGGLTFVNRIQESMGMSAPDIARAYVISRDVFRIRDLRTRINHLDGTVRSQVQLDAHQQVIAFLRRQVLWFLRYRPGDLRLRPAIETYRPDIQRLSDHLPEALSPFESERLEQRLEKLSRHNLSGALARDVALLEPLASACDIIDVARAQTWSPEDVTATYFAVGAALSLDRLRANASELSSTEHWERLAVKRTIEDLFRQQRHLTAAAIGQVLDAGHDNPSGHDAADIWIQTNEREVDRVTALIHDMEASGPLTSAKLSLAGSQIRDLMSGFGGRRSQLENMTGAL